MAIPVVMLNNNIKALAKYSKLLAKSKGSKPIKATCIGEGIGVTAKVLDELTLKSSNKRASVIPEVPDEPSDYSSSSSFISKLAVEDILSDESNVTQKLDDANNAETKKETDEQVTNEQVTKNNMEKKNMVMVNK
nr:hypothetical protein [Tanacetum cinerariifolium]